MQKPTNVWWAAFCCLSVVNSYAQQWDKDAGVIPPHTSNALISASSEDGSYPAGHVTDGNTDTYWKSENPLPENFLSSNAQNTLKASAGSILISNSAGTSSADIIDGQASTYTDINSSQGLYWADINLGGNKFLHTIAVKAQVQNNDSLIVYAFKPNGDSVKIAGYSSNYSIKNYPADIIISRLKLVSASAFKLFEVGATSAPLHEEVVIDLGQAKEIGWIRAEIHSSSLDSVHIQVSNDNINWVTIAKPAPKIYNTISYRAKALTNSRYLKVKCYVEETNYKRAEIHEIAVYDRFNTSGEMPAPTAAANPLKDMIGVNGIWGWGHNVYAKNLSVNQGQNLYKRVATHGRNYHNLNWDTSDPDNTPNFGGMPGSLNQNWLNWDDEYQAWQNAGVEPQATIQFLASKQPPSKWNNPYQAAYDYGYAFASHFGPTYGNGYVKALEVGNEPWDYDSTFYRTVLHGMAAGAKAADPAIEVFPCALQATDPSKEKGSHTKNYMGARITPTEAAYLDGINTHKYSYTFDSNGDRISTFPENVASGMRTLLNDIRFRDANMPGKKIYVSEWGWDSDGTGQSCTHGECVSEEAQALYAVRGLLMMNRLGVDRATWFFYANSNGGSSLYARSGLTGPVETGSSLKRSFKVFETIIQRMGDLYFLDTLSENEDAWMYLYGDSLGNPSHLVAWKPGDAGSNATSTVQIPLNYIADSAWSLDGIQIGGTATTVPAYNNGNLILNVSATPVLVSLSPKPVGLQENDTRANLNLFPNPSKGDFTVSLDLPEGGILDINLYSINGRKVSSLLSQNVNGGNQKFHFTHEKLSPGVYIIETSFKTSTSKLSQHQRLVITH